MRRATLATVLYQLKVSLKDVKPAVWRRVVVPADFTLFQLHEVIQVVMGWQDCHLHDFTIQRRRYAVPDPGDFDAHETADERKARLRQVVAPRSKFVYQYDFGDCWDHVVVVEDALDGDSDVVGLVPVCIGGAGACPPEDSGGPWGYKEKLRALAKPDDEEGDELREWLGDDFDPAHFDLAAANQHLQQAFRTKPRSKDAPKKRT